MDALRERVRLIAGLSLQHRHDLLKAMGYEGFWSHREMAGWGLPLGAFLSEEGACVGTREEWQAAVDAWRELGEPGRGALRLAGAHEITGAEPLHDYPNALRLWRFLYGPDEPKPTVTVQDLAGWPEGVLSESTYQWSEGETAVIVADRNSSVWHERGTRRAVSGLDAYGWVMADGIGYRPAVLWPESALPVRLPEGNMGMVLAYDTDAGWCFAWGNDLRERMEGVKRRGQTYLLATWTALKAAMDARARHSGPPEPTEPESTLDGPLPWADYLPEGCTPGDWASAHEPVDPATLRPGDVVLVHTGGQFVGRRVGSGPPRAAVDGVKVWLLRREGLGLLRHTAANLWPSRRFTDAEAMALRHALGMRTPAPAGSPADDCRAERKALGHEPMRMGWSAYEE